MATPTTGGSSDRELVLAFQAGRAGAYDEVYKRHHFRIQGVCVRMLGNPQDAEEAVQETFLRAYQALPRFNGEFQLGAWLARIATNVCVDHLRSRSRTHLVALPPEDAMEGDDGPEEVVVGDHPRLDEALSEIQPLHAQALALRAVQGLSHQEIAGHLAMTPAQVKALLHRARRSLRRAWDNAQGWIAAPIITWRAAFGRSEHASHAGPQMVSIAPQVPGLVEKVAASAVLVVVVLSGAPAVTGSVEAPGSQAAVTRSDRSVETERERERTFVAAAEPVSPNEEEIETAASVTEKIASTLEGKTSIDTDHKPNDDPNEGEGPNEGIEASVKSTTKKGKEVAARTLEAIAP